MCNSSPSPKPKKQRTRREPGVVPVQRPADLGARKGGCFKLSLKVKKKIKKKKKLMS